LNQANFFPQLLLGFFRLFRWVKNTSEGLGGIVTYAEVTIPGTSDTMATPVRTQTYAEVTVLMGEATVAYAEVTASGAIDTMANLLSTQAYAEVAVSGSGVAIAAPPRTQAHAEGAVLRGKATVAYTEVTVSGAVDTMAIFLST